VSASLFIIYKIFQLPFDFFIDRILDRYFRGNIVITPETSEGIRFKIWKAILDHTLINPFTGSTYLGTWILEGLQAGSAHNQYMDLLFRVGIIGFFLYIYLIFKTALFLYNGDKGLFWGTLGILIYGLFHETFKEPNGAFILSFLVGMYSTHIRCYAPSASTSKKIEPKNQDNSKIVTENLAA
jgi:O-antigen ligase